MALLRESARRMKAAAAQREGIFKERLDTTGAVFQAGLVRAIKGDILTPEAAAFPAGSKELAGVFMEGQATGAGLVDQLLPWTESAWTGVSAVALTQHPYEIHTGLGMSWGFLKVGLPQAMKSVNLHPLWSWFIVDGYGFQHGFFESQRYLCSQDAIASHGLDDYSSIVFYQGIGRSLWFVHAGNIEKIAEVINAAEPERISHLWTGVGVAAAHSGGVAEAQLKALKEVSGPHHKHLAVGAAVAAHIRDVASTKSSTTEIGCAILSNCPAQAAAGIVGKAVESALSSAGSGAPGATNAHAVWQQYILTHLPD